MAGQLPLPHILLALAVVLVWGMNFVIVKVALEHIPPFAFATLRFIFVAFPATLILPRPAVPWRHLAAYGFLIGAGQFGLLFYAIGGYISPGLASLVVQAQVFFTIALSMVFAGERIRPFQIAALLLALAGIAIIAANVDASTTPLGLALTLLAAASWACGNMVGKASGRVNMVAYVAWSSLSAVPPLALMSLLVEGAGPVMRALGTASWEGWAAVVWQSVGNSLFGYAAWAWLLSRNPAASITPMALLIPVVGLGSSALLLGEPLPPWKILAAVLVLCGLSVGLFWPSLVHALRRRGPML